MSPMGDIFHTNRLRSFSPTSPPCAGKLLSSNAVVISRSLLKPLDHVLEMGGQPQLCVPGWGHSTLDVPKHSCSVSPSYDIAQALNGQRLQRQRQPMVGLRWWAISGSCC